MDIPEMVVEPEIAAEQEELLDESEEYEEGIMIRHSDLLHFQDTLLDIRSQIKDVEAQFADFQRDARQDRLEVQEMFRAIMERLPPAAGPSAPPPAP
jgi:hypothetical protein